MAPRSNRVSANSRRLWRNERELRAQGFANVAGVDEAGRGPLAGPVVAGAAILPEGCRLPGLADSKMLSEKERERLFDLIQERAVCIGVGQVGSRMIDRMNVLNATHVAMRQAIAALDPSPDALLVDGRDLPSAEVPQRGVVKGDRLCACIAAASIVAKVTRDRMMVELDALYPAYGFAQHKGYATRAHLARLQELGPCPAHRATFAPVRALLQGRLPLPEGEPGTP